MGNAVEAPLNEPGFLRPPPLLWLAAAAAAAGTTSRAFTVHTLAADRLDRHGCVFAVEGFAGPLHGHGVCFDGHEISGPEGVGYFPAFPAPSIV